VRHAINCSPWGPGWSSFGCVFDDAGKRSRIAEIEKEIAAPGFWSDQQRAQSLMRELDQAKADVGVWAQLEAELRDQLELLEIAEQEGDQGVTSEVAVAAADLAHRLDQLELRLMLSGPFDERSAILAVHAGAGGTESQDWAEMLLRMYTRWAERRGYQTSVLDISEGEEAGIKSATLEIDGHLAYGYLRAERGVHRLVRLSPYDSAHRRHTSFALVEVLPTVDQQVEVTIPPEDVKVDVFRSSGAGGQNVQKTSTAIRITHIPTGIVVTCQNERSQVQNRETAFRILRSRLLAIEQEKREAEQAKLKGVHVAMGWGNQIRSYVLHPYNMVKDHRTEAETSNTAAVLDGDLDMFIEAYLRARIGES